jgi:hypothetical protein
MSKPEAPATIGPLGTLPIYPTSAWSRWPHDLKMDDVWRLCGPNVTRHLDRLPLWKVFCCVYYEGLVHGTQGTVAMLEAESKPKPDCLPGTLVEDW